MTNEPFPAVWGNPVLIQSRFGKQGNFELVTPLAAGGLAHFWRDNDASLFPWSYATTFGSQLGTVDAVTMIESNFGNPGNLEVICNVGGQLWSFWRDSGPAFFWNGPFQLPIAHAWGNPVLIQSRFGIQGNFELVAPLTTGGLVHYWRDNDDPNFPWYETTTFGTQLGRLLAVTMIESNFGDPGNLEVICTDVYGNIWYFWRDSGPAFAWNGPTELPIANAFGNPVLIQSRFGNQGNFELVTPLTLGGLVHYWRDNDDPNLPWKESTTFGNVLGAVKTVTMIESNFGNPGNLEVICNQAIELSYMWRDSGPAFDWSYPWPMSSTT